MQKNRKWEMLSRGEVRKAVERKGPKRIPLVFARWWGEGLWEQYGERLREFDKYPEDAAFVWVNPYDIGKMKLSWQIKARVAHDAGGVISEWSQLDEFIEKLPEAEQDAQFDGLIEAAQKAHAQDRYLLFAWWSLFFERPWGLRGMENLMVDYYEYPDKIHQLHDALCKVYCGYIRRAIREFQPDGFWTSDDLGNQRQLMMRPETFRAFLKPYYGRVGAACKEGKVHWWLHSCGNNTVVMGDLAETGVSVFHPVQKGTMEEAAVAREFGDRMAFLTGFDVQHILQEGTPAEVRKEVRFLIDTFDGPGGGMAIAAGNGIVSGTPFENIDAFLEEALIYGEEHRAKFG